MSPSCSSLLFRAEIQLFTHRLRVHTCLCTSVRVRHQSSSSDSTSSSPRPRSYSSSVNPSEVDHFTALASSWWDPHGPSRLLHLMNPLRHDFIQQCLSTLPRADPVSLNDKHEQAIQGRKYSYLDIGCGGGIFASSAARLRDTESVVGVDPTKEVIEVARRQARRDVRTATKQHGGDGILRYVNCAIEDLQDVFDQEDSDIELSGQQRPQNTTKPHSINASEFQTLSTVATAATLTTNFDSPGISSGTISSPDHTSQSEKTASTQFDYVTLFEVIEHIPYPTAFLYSCLQHLKPGGWLIGSTIARHPISYITTKLIAEAPWPIGVVPRGTHDWNQYINPQELDEWVVKENGKAMMEDEGKGKARYGTLKVQGVVYLPILGWRFVDKMEGYGNYFFGVRKLRH